jgi:hypothetical protein
LNSLGRGSQGNIDYFPDQNLVTKVDMMVDSACDMGCSVQTQLGRCHSASGSSLILATSLFPEWRSVYESMCKGSRDRSMSSIICQEDDDLMKDDVGSTTTSTYLSPEAEADRSHASVYPGDAHSRDKMGPVMPIGLTRPTQLMW